MKHFITASAVLALTAGGAMAGGMGRTDQSVGLLFKPGSYVELGFKYADPDGDGTFIVPGLEDADTGDTFKSYNNFSAGFKSDINDKLSYALIMEQPMGSDTRCEASHALCAGSKTRARSTSVTGLLRYKATPNVSVFGGLRAQSLEYDLDIRGAGFGGLNGYSVSFDRDWGLGFVAGAAYEIPEKAVRVALTYNSAIDVELDTVESFGGTQVAPASVTDVTIPESINLELQTGLNRRTLAFGSIRWVNWDEYTFPAQFYGGATGGNTIGTFEDSISYQVGLARAINEKFSVIGSVAYEKEGYDLASPLRPIDGKTTLTLAGIYKNNGMEITTGVSYVILGDAEVGVGGVKIADYEDNDAIGFGIKVGYSF